jgi:hypothetical protein
MATLSIMRRKAAEGKFRNQEPLEVAFADRDGEVMLPTNNACDWEEFQFHLATVIPRARLHQADRELRAKGATTVEVDDSLIDEVWLKSFVLTAT